MTVTAADFDVPFETLFDRTACLVPDVQFFTANGTWTKPAHALLVKIEMIGGGYPGAAGETSSTGRGGGGGARGNYLEVTLPAALVPASFTVGIGTPGVASAVADGAGFFIDTTAPVLAAQTGLAGGDGGGLDPSADTDGEGGAGGGANIGGRPRGMFSVGGGGSGGSGGGGNGGEGAPGIGANGGAGGVGSPGGSGGLGGAGGAGYGAGGGGGGGGVAGGGGGGGASGWGAATGGASGGSHAVAGVGGAGGAGFHGAVMVTTWRGVAL